MLYKFLVTVVMFHDVTLEKNGIIGEDIYPTHSFCDTLEEAIKFATFDDDPNVANKATIKIISAPETGAYSHIKDKLIAKGTAFANVPVARYEVRKMTSYGHNITAYTFITFNCLHEKN